MSRRRSLIERGAELQICRAYGVGAGAVSGCVARPESSGLGFATDLLLLRETG